MRHMFESSYQLLLDKEGKTVSNHKTDPGGMTAFGVSRRFWPDLPIWPIIDDLVITGLYTDERAYERVEKHLRKFYKDEFWTKVSGNDLPAGIDMFMLLAAVNKGVHTTTTSLQWAVRATEDGSIGPKTLEAVSAYPPAVVLDRLLRRCLYRYMQVSSAENRKDNGMGWINRVFDVYEIAQQEF